MVMSAVGTDQRIEFSVSASAAPPMICASQSVLDFGSCAVGEVQVCRPTHLTSNWLISIQDLTFDIINASAALPASIAIPRIANFQFSPLSALILPGQRLAVKASFAPKQIGDCSRRLVIPSASGTYDLVVDLRAKCGLDPAYSTVAPLELTAATGRINRTLRRIPDGSRDSQLAFRIGMAGVSSAKSNGFSYPDGTQQLGIHATIGLTSRQRRPIKPSPALYQPLNPSYTFLPAELEKKNSEDDKYQKLIRSFADTRLNAELKRKEKEALKYNTAVDIGIEPGSHLSGPVPSPQPITPSKSPKRASTGSVGLTRASLYSNQSPSKSAGSLTRKKLPKTSLTTTSSPARAFDPNILKQKLTPMQLYNVVLQGPRTIDFGNVCEGSENVYILEIDNNIDQHVKVAFTADCNELADINNATQVIAPRQTALFRAILANITPNTPRTFHRGLRYTINDNHHYDLLVDAKVVRPSLQLSTDKVTVVIGAFHRASASLTLKNPFASLAKFSWLYASDESKASSSPFSVSPAHGTVGPNETLACLVEYTPGFNYEKTTVFNLRLHAPDAADQVLTCTADYGKPAIEFVDKRMLFGAVSTKSDTKQLVQVRNTSLSDAYFQVDSITSRPVHDAEVRIEPSFGRIPARGSVTLSVIVCLQSPVKFEGSFVVNVRTRDAAVSGKYTLTGNAEAPDVIASPATLSIGRVSRGAHCRAPFSLTNTKHSAVTVHFDLSLYEDFSIVVPADPINGTDEQLLDVVKPTAEDSHAQDVGTLSTDALETRMSRLSSLQALVEQVKQMRKFLERGEFESGAEQTYLSEIQQLELQIVNLQRLLELPVLQVSSRGLQQRIDIPAGATVPLLLDFLPLQVASYDFHVPATVNQIPLAVPIRVTATAVRPALNISSRRLDFGRVLTTTAELSKSKPQTITFTCASSSTVTFHLDLTQLGIGNNRGFHVESDGVVFGEKSAEITLAPQQSIQMRFSFVPEADGWAEARVPVLLHDGTSGVYAHLELRAWGTKAFFSFSEPRVVLPILPLGVPSQALVYLRAFGYDADALSRPVQFTQPEMPDGSPITVEFPEGNVFKAKAGSGSQCEPLPVAFRFASETAVSLSYHMHFIDAYGQSFALTVSASADSCLLSLYPYIAEHRNAYYVKTAGDYDASSYHGAITHYVARWYTLFGLPTRQEIRIPESMTANYGATAFDIIKFISGQDAPGLPLVRPKNVRPGAVLGMYRSLVNYLKISGAALSHVPVESLLCASDFADFKREQWQKMKFANTISLPAGTLRKNELDDMEADLPSVSERAWTIVLAEAWKVFVLARVTPASLREVMRRTRVTDGTDAFLKASDVEFERILETATNNGIHSTKEVLILQWLTLTHQEVTKSEQIVENFGDDLSDGTVLASVLSFYIPSLAESHFSDLFPFATELDQRRHNVIRVLAACQSISLSFTLCAEDVLRPNPCFTLMLCVHLYEVLPQYIPKRDPIVFSGLLQSLMTKDVKLDNPSKQQLVYRAIIAASDDSDFSVPPSIVVPVKGSAELPVSFLARQLRHQEATLVLIGDPASGAAGSVLAFSLTSNVYVSAQTESIIAPQSSTCPCYSINKHPIEVRNIWKQGGDFKVRVFTLSKEDVPKVTAKRRSGPAQNITAPSLISMFDLESRHTLPSFWADESSISLGADASATIHINYVPLTEGEHRCVVVLSNPSVGDLFHVVKCRAHQPEPQAVVRWACAGNAGSIQKLNIPYENSGRLRALSALPNTSIRDAAFAKNLTITTANGVLLSEAVQLSVEFRGSSCFAGADTVRLVPGVASSKGTAFAPQVCMVTHS